MGHCLVFDIGKTHIKWHVLDDDFNTLCLEEMCNRVEAGAPYPHFDIDHIWQLFINKVGKLPMVANISRICVTTHGATAALIDRHQSDNGLVLPVMDYEFDGVESINAAYRELRPGFAETGSPDLPEGMNLGRQLFWQQQQFPEAFARTTDILLYPQYWVWRLSGQCVSEVTSLGCHTDLWAPWQRDYSSLVKQAGWLSKFPRLASAWDNAGTIKPAIAQQTGLPAACEVFVGVHDSNASYLRYKRVMGETPFSIISTGTWSIVMNSVGERSKLQDGRDMLVNVDVYGNPVVCSRFMGGREYAAVCEALGGELHAEFSEHDIAQLVANGIVCLPCWKRGTGPLRDHVPEIINPQQAAITPAALASLYCALILDYQLDLVGSHGDVIVGGAFLKNPLLCRLLAQLRGTQTLKVSSDITGTVVGAAALARWEHTAEPVLAQVLDSTQFEALSRYRDAWRTRLNIA